MPVHDADIAALFEEIADLMEIEGANVFRIRAYRNTSRTLQEPVGEAGRAEHASAQGTVRPLLRRTL